MAYIEKNMSRTHQHWRLGFICNSYVHLRSLSWSQNKRTWSVSSKWCFGISFSEREGNYVVPRPAQFINNDLDSDRWIWKKYSKDQDFSRKCHYQHIMLKYGNGPRALELRARAVSIEKWTYLLALGVMCLPFICSVHQCEEIMWKFDSPWWALYINAWFGLYLGDVVAPQHRVFWVTWYAIWYLATHFFCGPTLSALVFGGLQAGRVSPLCHPYLKHIKGCLSQIYNIIFPFFSFTKLT